MVSVYAEVFQRKDHDQDNLIKIEMADVCVVSFNIFKFLEIS